MKLDKLIGERYKERPADSVIESHALMVRGGYIKNVANGLFSSYNVMRRIARKIEDIIREEMDAIDGQEVLFPVVLPASLWEESGRYESVGKELLRFVDRNGSPMLLGMTHEEAAVHLVREYGQSYTKYPFMIYQIQTKFRDEARPRGGLIRVREFTMKDGYSFHRTQEDLEEYYERCHEAYEKIFARAGLPEVISVASDSGMMGGKVAHEFMLLTAIGEDSIVTCSCCEFRANMEAAASIVTNESVEPLQPLQKIHTPGTVTIEEVCNYLKLPIEKSCKAVVYQIIQTQEYVVVFIRGDLDVNETKLRNYLKEEIYPANLEENSGLVAGYLGPHKTDRAIMLFDDSLRGINDLCCGANEAEHHYVGFQIDRDYGDAEYHDFAKATKDGICPECGNASLLISRGVELGNIFQLGDKYTVSMEMKYTDENDDIQIPIMGCYGIGVGRLAASVCEARRDENGPIWPMSIAPWQVHICCLRADDEKTKAYADELYEEMQKRGIEVIYDDRVVSAGVMFSEADLLGVPLRVIVSPRNMEEECCEITSRDKSVEFKAKFDEVIPSVKRLIEEMISI